MAQASAPEKLDPQDIVKLLVALRRAMKPQPSARTGVLHETKPGQ